MSRYPTQNRRDQARQQLAGGSAALVENSQFDLYGQVLGLGEGRAVFIEVAVNLQRELVARTARVNHRGEIREGVNAFAVRRVNNVVDLYARLAGCALALHLNDLQTAGAIVFIGSSGPS